MRYQLQHSFRILFKYRLYTGIALMGLGISISSVWFITDYVQSAYQYDAFHQNQDRIYRLTMEVAAGGNTDHYATTGLPAGDLLQKNYPGIVAYARLGFHNSVVKLQEEVFRESGFFQANSQTLDVFSFDWVNGNRATAPVLPNSIVLTRSLAEKYFNSTDISGKQLTVGEDLYTVTGVFQDWPSNSHLKVNALLFKEERTDYEPQNWFDLENYTYLLLHPSNPPNNLNDQLEAFTDQQLSPLLEDSGLAVKFHAQPLGKVYFSPGLVDDVPKGNWMYVLALAFAGILVFLVAGLNFINLTLSRSTQRAKEIHLKKVLGISRKQLLWQSGTESGVMTLLVLLIATLLILLFGKFYFDYTGLHANTLSGKWLFIGIAPLLVFVFGLLGTSYSGAYLSFSSRSTYQEGAKVGMFKNVLLGFQYIITGVILIITLTMGRQLDFLKNKDLGFSQEQVLIVALPDQETLNSRSLQFREQLRASTAIKNAALVGGGALPGEQNGKEVFEVTVDGEKTEKVYNIYRIDEHYFDLLEIKMAAGRNFDADQLSDRNGSVIINETLAKALNWEDPLNKVIWYGGEMRKVIGLVKNFHNKSLHHIIEPIVFLFETDYANHLLVKAPASEVGRIQSQWADLFPEAPFSLTYFEQFLARMYKQEDQLTQLFRFFSMVTLLLCCTGLFALFSLHVLQKTREMSIRKVLGAGYLNLLRSVTRNYRNITVLSIGLAIPIAWLVVNR